MKEQPEMQSLDAVIVTHCANVLLACRGNKVMAAEVLCISRSTLYRYLARLPKGAWQR